MKMNIPKPSVNTDIAIDFIDDISRRDFPDWSNKKIEERIKEIENEKESLEYNLTRLENELFYRKYPECCK